MIGVPLRVLGYELRWAQGLKTHDGMLQVQ